VAPSDEETSTWRPFGRIDKPCLYFLGLLEFLAQPNTRHRLVQLELRLWLRFLLFFLFPLCTKVDGWPVTIASNPATAAAMIDSPLFPRLSLIHDPLYQREAFRR
jgi:hypothetical protein